MRIAFSPDREVSPRPAFRAGGVDGNAASQGSGKLEPLRLSTGFCVVKLKIEEPNQEDGIKKAAG
jgi:hypothetical protein